MLLSSVGWLMSPTNLASYWISEAWGVYGDSSSSTKSICELNWRVDDEAIRAANTTANKFFILL